MVVDGRRQYWRPETKEGAEAGTLGREEVLAWVRAVGRDPGTSVVGGGEEGGESRTRSRSLPEVKE